MKNISLSFIISCGLFAGCSSSVLEGPPIISKVELNTDSTHDHTSGTYMIHLQSTQGCDPVFYSYDRYNSGEVLVPMSSLQSTIDRKTKPYLDTIASLQRRIDRLKSENEETKRQLDEKETLIRFLTGK